MGDICPFCQAKNDKGVIFCYRCGKEFGLKKISTELELSLKKIFTVHKVDLKDIMKYTLKTMVIITIMMFFMILVTMVFTDLLRK